MTIGELIDILQCYPDGAPVRIEWGGIVLGIADVHRLGEGVAIEVKSQSLVS